MRASTTGAIPRLAIAGKGPGRLGALGAGHLCLAEPKRTQLDDDLALRQIAAATVSSKHRD